MGKCVSHGGGLGGFHYNNLMVVILLLGIGMSWFSGSYGQMVPGIYVFGDSLVDVGNNNHLELSIAKSNFPHNGIDFPGKKATGRFSNGYNAADFLSDKVGLPTSPPYLSLVSNKTNTGSPLTGVSFASGGAGIFNGTDDTYKQSIPLPKQVVYFQTVHGDLMTRMGSTAAHYHFWKSLFVVTVGSNDVFDYSGSSDLQKKYNFQQYADLMASSLKEQFKRLYNHNARKFLVVGLGPIGCCPSERHKNTTGECRQVPNQLALKYNQAVLAMLGAFKAEFKDMTYSFFDTYSVMQSFIQNPTSHGFTEVKAACCGLGRLNAKIACLPISKYCSNRKDHLFWDLYHPTEVAAKMFIDRAFDGTPPTTYPVNVRQLIAV